MVLPLFYHAKLVKFQVRSSEAEETGVEAFSAWTPKSLLSGNAKMLESSTTVGFYFCYGAF